MTGHNAYTDTIDTIYPDGFARESYFRDTGDMLDPPSRQAVHSGRGWLWRLWEGLSLRLAKRKGRLVLRELTEHQLLDIGVTRCEVDQEVSKSFFWD